MMGWRDQLTRDELALLAIIEKKRAALKEEQRVLTKEFNSLLARGWMRQQREENPK